MASDESVAPDGSGGYKTPKKARKPRRLTLGPLGVGRLENLPQSNEGRQFIITMRDRLAAYLGDAANDMQLALVLDAVHLTYLAAQMRDGHHVRSAITSEELKDYLGTVGAMRDTFKMLGIKTPKAAGPDLGKYLEGLQDATPPAADSPVSPEPAPATSPAPAPARTSEAPSDG